MPKACMVISGITLTLTMVSKGTFIMRILVIGGTNFMGPLVVGSLREQGHEITVFHRGQTQANLPLGVREILGDRRPFTYIATELNSLAPDILLNIIPPIQQYAQDIISSFC